MILLINAKKVRYIEVRYIGLLICIVVKQNGKMSVIFISEIFDTPL